MKHKTRQYLKACGCRSVGECSHLAVAGYAALDAVNACVDEFAEELKRKLVRKAMEGKHGWDDPEWPRADIIRQLREHVDKGDMLDVAAFAMFAWNQER